MCSPRHWMAAGWNACSSCHGDSGRARKYLVLPCVGSGRVYGERIGPQLLYSLVTDGCCPAWAPGLW